MPICHDGHDHDADLTPECPTCRELIHDAEHHTCHRLQETP